MSEEDLDLSLFECEDCGEDLDECECDDEGAEFDELDDNEDFEE
jgi:transcription initiation factor IIE alpha subunit